MAESVLPAASNISIYTTRCDPNHCFSQVKKGGCLDGCVIKRGGYVPASLPVFQYSLFTALFSNIRVCYLALCLVWDVLVNKKGIDVLVVDVLPSPLIVLKLLLPNLPCCFYCHFPDKFLVRNTINGVVISKPSLLRRLYRHPMDKLEEFALSYADSVGVNSNFTGGVFKDAFPSLKAAKPSVLYPAINLKAFTHPLEVKVRTEQRLMMGMM